MPSSIDSISLYSRLQQDISKAQIELARLNRQISTGRKLLTYSDDISASSRSYRLQNTLNKQNMFLTTISQSKTRLEATDSTLGEVDTIMIGVKQIAIDMGQSSATGAMRLAEAEVVSQNLQGIVDLANTQLADQYLFSGFNSSQDPFENLGNEVIFHGDTRETQAQIAEGTFIETTLNPEVPFGDLTAQAQSLDLNARLSFGDGGFKSQATGTATDNVTVIDSSLIGFTGNLIGLELFVFAGTGVGENATIISFDSATGTITLDSADALTTATDATTEYSLSQGNAGTFLSDLEGGFDGGTIEITTTEFTTGVEVDLSSAKTLSDVKKIIEDVSSRLSVTLTAAGDGIVVTDSAGTAITIADVGSGTAAQKLEINGTNASGVITGGDLNPQLTRETLLSDVAGALNNPISIGSIYITQGSRQSAVDLSSATTVGEMLDLIEGAQTTSGVDYHLDAFIDSDSEGIVIASRVSGSSFSLSNASSTDQTTEDLGLLTMTGSISIGSIRNGKGLDTAVGEDFFIEISGVDNPVDLTGVQTLQDVVDAINVQVTGVTASINNIQGNRLEITSATPIAIKAGLSNAAQQLGFQLGVSGTTQQGTDITALEVNSIFTATINLLTGLQNDDQSAILLSEADLDARFDDLLLGRSRAGGRLDRLDLTQTYLENQKIFVTEDLVNNRDVDLTQAIADLQTMELSLQATLATTSSILNLTLINFL